MTSDLPRHRIRPPAGWLNDPNGPIWWDGRCHVFFQFNPHAAVHERICWGHATSTDLVSWTYEPVALEPTDGSADAAGCWSGCVVDDAGTATAVYTGGGEDQTICLAYADDDSLRTWRKLPDPVARAPYDGLSGFRDPFVFHLDGHRYALVGAGEHARGRASVLVYLCDDLREWTLLGTFLDTSDPVAAEIAPADFWECPHLIRLGERWVLVLSSVVDDAAGRVSYLLGDVVPTDSGPRFRPSHGGLVDHGHDFYAPAVMTHEGRALLWAWTWEDRPAEEVRAAGWAGALTVTRQLTLAPDGRLRNEPIAELSTLHRDETVVTLDGPGSVGLPAGPLDLDVEVRAGASGRVVLTVSGLLELSLDLVRGSAAVRREVHEPGRRDWDVSGTFPPAGLSRHVRIVLDGSVAEIFVEDGPSFTERIYATGPPTLEILAAAGAVRVRRLG